MNSFVKRLLSFTILLVVISLLVSLIGLREQATITNMYASITMLAAIILFIVLKRKELLVYEFDFSKKQAILFGVLSYVFVVLYIMQQNTRLDNVTNYLFLGWILQAIAIVFLYLSIFQVQFTKTFLKPILATIATALIYINLAFLLNTLGHPIARLLTYPLKAILELTNKVTIEFTPGPAPLVEVNNFSAYVGPPCTGITSLLLFTALYLIVFFIDFEKINIKQAIKYYLIGLIGMFLLAFIRLTVLFYIGANINPVLAIEGFHDNAGWIFFILYFFVYFWYSYPRIIKKYKRNV